MYGFNNRNDYLIVWEAKSSRSRCQQDWIILRPSSLTCRYLSSLCIFTQSFLCACIQVFSFHKGTSYSELKPTASFNCLFKNSISKNSHILKYCGVRISTFKFLGNIIQPIRNSSKTLIFRLKEFIHLCHHHSRQYCDDNKNTDWERM